MVYKFVWVNDRLAVEPAWQTIHSALLSSLGYDHWNHPNVVTGIYNSEWENDQYFPNGPLKIFAMEGNVPSKDQLIAEIEAKILPDHTGNFFLATQATRISYGNYPYAFLFVAPE